METSFAVPVISVVGYSGAGKTTYLEKLIPALKKRGLRLCVIKHDAHSFEIDVPGKDSWRLAQAGADIVMLSSPDKLAVIEIRTEQESLEQLSERLRGKADLILTEGFKRGHARKIEIRRAAVERQPVCGAEELFAVAADYAGEAPGVPWLPLDDAEEMADLIVKYACSREAVSAGKRSGEVSKPSHNRESERYGVSDSGLPSLEHAVELLLAKTGVITRTELVPLTMAGGRLAAEEISANMDLPPFDRSPLDGYALRAEDSSGASAESPVTLKVAAEIPAGAYWGGVLTEGCAIRVMTGTMLPTGADCVVKQEDTDDGEQAVKIYKPLKQWQNFCFRGEDVKAGTQIVAGGTRLNYAHLGVLSGIGVSHVRIRDQCRAGLLSVGDELTVPGEPLAPGKIYNSNIYMLSERMAEFGISAKVFSKVVDNVNAICEIIEREIDGVDVFFTTGGVSVGRRDFMPEVVERLGAKRLFWRVALKPGTPVLAAVYRNKLLLCLSGNPFAAATNFELLGRPVLAGLSGDNRINYNRTKAVMDAGFGKSSPGRRFVRAVYTDGKVRPSGFNHSPGALLSLLGCNALIDIPAGTGPLNPGDEVEVVLL